MQVLEWVLVVSLLLLISILVVLGIRAQQKQKEEWEDYVDSMYRKYLHRPVDLVFHHYYQDKDISFIREDLRNYIYHVQQGRKHLKTKTVAVAGLLRNCRENISSLKKWYHELSHSCKQSYFVIVENDSTDGTREELLQWNRKDPSVTILCASSSVGINQPECPVDKVNAQEYSKSPSHARIKKMAFLRNVYLKHLQKLDKKIDLVLVMDLDLRGEFFMDGLCDSIAYMEEDPNMDAIACNGMMLAACSISATNLTYYDSFAYVHRNEPGEWNTLFDKRSHDDEVIRYTSKKYLEGNMQLDPVMSAFGGACVYRASSLKGIRYSSSKDRYVCEHTRLHQHLNTMYVNPRMLFMIEKNLG
jgi:glycosyltransferase involved in cell wall biosynthesis